MNDLVKRLRDLPYRPMVNYGNGDVRDELDPDISEAADEIERLKSEVELWKGCCQMEIDAIEGLRAEVKLWKDRCAAEHEAHQATIEHCDKMLSDVRRQDEWRSIHD